MSIGPILLEKIEEYAKEALSYSTRILSRDTDIKIALFSSNNNQQDQ